MKVYECAQKLVETIKNSEEYKKFIKAKTAVDEKPELKLKLEDFLKRRFYLRVTHSDIDLQTSDAFHQLQEEYGDLVMNPEVQNYIKSEQIIMEMITNIYEIIGESIELDLDFLNH